MAKLRANNFDCGQPDGTTVTAANSGGGTANDAFDGGPGSCIYDSTYAHSGTQSMTPGTTAQSRAEWQTISGSTLGGRFYLYIPAAWTAGGVRIAQADGDTTGNLFRISIQSATGKITANIGGSGSHSTSVAMPTGQWVRIEWLATLDGTTANFDVSVWYTDPDSAGAADETLHSSVANTNTSFRSTGIGSGSAAGQQYWLDDFAIDDAAMPGPLVVSSSYTLPVGLIPSGEAVRGHDLVSGLLVDTYQRTVASSIGTSDSGHTAVLDQGTATDYNVSPGALGITMPAGQAPIWHYPVDLRHFDLTFDYEFDTTPTGSTQSIGPAWWVADALNYYRLVITQTTGGNTNLLVEQQVNNLDTPVPMDWGSGAQTTTKALLTAQVAATKYRVRVKCYDNAGTDEFLVKVWPDGTAEPSDTPGRSGGAIVGLGAGIAGAYQTHGGLGGRGQTLAANTNTPIYSISNFAAQSLDAPAASYTLPIGKITSGEAVRGILLSRTIALPIGAIPASGSVRGIGTRLSGSLPVGHVSSSGAIRGASLVRATQLALGLIPSAATVRGVTLVGVAPTPRPIVRVVPCYNGSATVSLFVPREEVSVSSYDVEVQL